MPFLICEPNDDHCAVVEISPNLQDSADIIHAHLCATETDEPVTLSNSFVAFRPMNKQELPDVLPRGWKHIFAAYVVRFGVPAPTNDTEMFVLEF